MIRNWYASDTRFHADTKAKAEAARAACDGTACLRAMLGDYSETTWTRRDDRGPRLPDLKGSTRTLGVDDWADCLKSFATSFGVTNGTLPVGRLSDLDETAEGFSVTAVLAQRDGELTTASVVWPKRSFDAWWDAERAAIGSTIVRPPGTFTLPSAQSTSCTNDTWSRTRYQAPDARTNPDAIWTGTEMIVWGGSRAAVGYALDYILNGARYNPSTDTWIPISTGANVPLFRYVTTSVWTGTEMIIWGGFDAGDILVNTGARYNPSSDTWTGTSTGANVPSDRYYHSALWTGTQMLVWGGNDEGILLNTGGRYNPSTNTWATISTGANAPIARDEYTAVWTGSEMIIWGGVNANNFNTGGRYNPATNTWAATSTGANVPESRFKHTAVWTGSEMIVWGGRSNRQLSTGGRYNPSNNTWAPTSTGAGVPDRGDQSAVWTGSEMVVWGGKFRDGPWTNSGGSYNPALDSWLATSTASGAPAARENPAATWTGTEMIVWGGGTSSTDFNTGGRYDPASDSWTATSTGANVPSARHQHSSVWTGTELVIWGGQDQSFSLFNDGGRYNPATDSWTPTSVGANVPVARIAHSATWSGSEMIVWGGAGIDAVLDTGGRYNPATDGWTATSTTDVPTPRTGHTGVWTGTEMTVWGGINDSELNTGGRYEPATDSWSPTSTGASLPTARQAHTAVWTGEEMIVWGGTPQSEQGGRYCTCPNGIGVFYRDLDGDGHGNAAVSEPACNELAGFVASGDDCNDANPAVYPGAPELNDGVDNQCPGGSGYGIVDEIADTLHVDSGGVACWTDSSGAATYDVARSSSRDLSPCDIVGSATNASPCLTDSTVPPAGSAFYYVVRAASPNVGSWGKSSSGAERSLSCP